MSGSEYDACPSDVTRVAVVPLQEAGGTYRSFQQTGGPNNLGQPAVSRNRLVYLDENRPIPRLSIQHALAPRPLALFSTDCQVYVESFERCPAEHHETRLALAILSTAEQEIAEDDHSHGDDSEERSPAVRGLKRHIQDDERRKQRSASGRARQRRRESSPPV